MLSNLLRTEVHMSVNNQEDKFLEDERRLELGLNVREQIIQELVHGGIPTNIDNRQFLLAAIEGMDRTILARRKIKVDSEADKNNKESMDAIVGVLTGLNRKTIKQRRDRPSLDSSFVVKDEVPDEIYQGVQNIQLTDIIKE